MKVLLSLFSTGNGIIADLGNTTINLSNPKYNGSTYSPSYIFGKEYKKYKHLGFAGSKGAGYDIFLLIDLDKINESEINYDNIDFFLKHHNIKYNNVHEPNILTNIQKKFPYILYAGITDVYTVGFNVHYDISGNVNGIILDG